MKVVAVMSGAVAVRLTIEDVLPKIRVPLQDLLAAIAQRYSFMSMSEVAAPSPIVFQNGKLVKPDRPIPIIQLQIMQGGDIIFAPNTEDADKIMEDFLGYLVSDFDYDLSAIKRKTYLSAVVVEFENNSKNVISSMFMLEELINRKYKSAAPQKYLKRLAFGLPDHDPGIPIQQQLSPLDAIEGGDFLIERRVGSDPDSNRFFSSASLKTTDHISLLEEIENAMAADFA